MMALRALSFPGIGVDASLARVAPAIGLPRCNGLRDDGLTLLTRRVAQAHTSCPRCPG
jgi:hypothetical protein